MTSEQAAVAVRPLELTVCLVTEDREPVERILQALRSQDTTSETFDVVVVDATQSGALGDLPSAGGPSVHVVRADAGGGRAALLNAAWRASTGSGVVFLSQRLTPAPLWVAAMTAALRRGRRLVTGPVFADIKSMDGSPPGLMSYRLWANPHEASVISADNFGCLRADLEAVGGWRADVADDVADTDLALRLIETGVDRHWARHAVAFRDLEPVSLSAMVAQRSVGLRAQAATLAEHPRAGDRLLFVGAFRHRYHAELLLLAVGVATAPRRRPALLLAVPWIHERICLTPAGGGTRRRWFVLPGRLCFDAYDVMLTLATRLRRQKG